MGKVYKLYILGIQVPGILDFRTRKITRTHKTALEYNVNVY